MSMSIDSNKLSHIRRPPECDLAASTMSSRRKDEFLGEIELVGFLGEIKIQIHGGTHVLADGSRTQYKRKMDFLGEIQIQIQTHGEIQSTSSMGSEYSYHQMLMDPSPSTPSLNADDEDATPSRTRARACR
jgi:hypothetical protein